VNIEQPQPRVTVRQQAPTVTIDQPPPEIVVHMPQPQVDVQDRDPGVSVNVPPPQVHVEQQGGSARVQVQSRSDDAAQVQYERARPQVKFERAGEPRVVYRPTEQEPKVRYESERQEAASTRQQQAASSRSGSMPSHRMRKPVRGNARFVILASGGFLGLFQDEVALPVERFRASGDRLVVSGLTDQDIDNMQDWEDRLPNSSVLDDAQSVRIRK
jgi:hypothetical protein